MVSKDALELSLLLPLPTDSCDDRHTPERLVYEVVVMELGLGTCQASALLAVPSD